MDIETTEIDDTNGGNPLTTGQLDRGEEDGRNI